MSSQKPQAQKELEKFDGDDPEADREKMRNPRTQRESGVPTIETDLPEPRPDPLPDLGGNLRQAR